MKKWLASFHPYAAVTILFWSIAYVFTRLTLTYFSAFSLGFLRYLIASCTLIVVAVLTRMKPPSKADIPWLVASGAAGIFLYMIAFNQGQATVTASTASVIIATVPVLTALLARIFYGEKLQPVQWIAIVVEFAGVVILTVLHGGLSINKGLAWLLIAAVLLSIYNLLQRKLSLGNPLRSSTYSIFFGTLMLAIFAPTAVAEVASAPPIQFFYLAVLGIGSGALAYVCWTKAFSKAKQTSQVSNYMFLTPFLASLLGFLVANEVPDRATLVGGGIILLGVLLFNFGGAILHRVQHAK